jgi:hypothetical protein
MYGLDGSLVYAEALQIISSGADLALHQPVGMSARALRQRAHPKPRKRKVRCKPEAWRFEEGTVVAYPTTANQPINPPYTPSGDGGLDNRRLGRVLRNSPLG